MKKIVKRKNCRACGNNNVHRVLRYNDTPIGDDFRKKPYRHKKYPIELYLCKKCGLAQLLHVVNHKLLYSKYIYKTQDSPGLMKHFQNFANHVSKKIKLKAKSKVLDIGSNDGILLKEFKKKNFVVRGIEPAKQISEEANKKNIKTYNDFLNKKLTKKIIKNEGQFDLIISNNVFANVDNVNNWIKDIKCILKKNGTYIFETYYLYNLIQNKVFDFIYHEHLTAFSVKPLYELFKRHDLLLFDVEFISTKGGSIRCYVSNNKNIKMPKKIENLINKEIKYGLFDPNRFKKFQKEINLLSSSTYNFLNKLKSNKNENAIVGYGASISCTTLIYHFKIKKFIDHLVDDNNNKINRYLPGSSLKVYDSKKLLNIKFDYVIILAWRFSDMIIKKIKKIKGKRKIKIIIPCPNFRVINL